MRFVYFSLLICSYHQAFANGDTIQTIEQPFKIRALTINPLIFNVYNNHATQSDFRKLSSDNEITNIDLTNYQKFYSGDDSRGIGINISAIIEMNLKHANDFQINFSQYSTTCLSAQYIKKTKGRTDTLFTSSGNFVNFIDTAFYSNYIINYKVKYCDFSVSYIHNLNPQEGVSFFGGINIGFAKAYNSIIETRKWKEIEVYPSYYNSIIYSRSTTSMYEKASTKNGFKLSFTWPVGIDFKLSLNDPILKRIHFFSESRTGIHLFYIPLLGFKSSLATQFGAGLRMDLF